MMTKKEKVALVPRLSGQGYSQEDIASRREWITNQTGAALQHVAACSIPGEDMRGNIENPIGSVQMPLGVAGPLRIKGQHADGVFYVPMATTEGALVRSYERGMVTLTRSGGVETHVYKDENQIVPTMLFESVQEAAEFTEALPGLIPDLKAAAESTTSHGKLLRVEPYPVGRRVLLAFCYSTGDAQGMNMIAKATDHACRLLRERGLVKDFQIFSGMGSEKRASGHLFNGGKGKTVVAGAHIPARAVRTYLHVTPSDMYELWQNTILGHIRANAIGFNGHIANGLTALFIATGQDVANVVNASTGISHLELTPEGDLYVSVTLTSLTLATVGGGVGLGSNRECLEMLDCHGSGKARKLAEIAAATALAGEISFSAAIASGEFVQAHENYGRNRPRE